MIAAPPVPLEVVIPQAGDRHVEGLVVAAQEWMAARLDPVAGMETMGARMRPGVGRVTATSEDGDRPGAVHFAAVLEMDQEPLAGATAVMVTGALIHAVPMTAVRVNGVLKIAALKTVARMTGVSTPSALKTVARVTVVMETVVMETAASKAGALRIAVMAISALRGIALTTGVSLIAVLERVVSVMATTAAFALAVASAEIVRLKISPAEKRLPMELIL